MTLKPMPISHTAPWPHYASDEIAGVVAVLRSGRVNYWTGEEGRAFEREYALACGVRYAVAVANGTVALELTLRAMGIGPGDDVVVTPRSFIASASCVVAVGAKPVFADVDRVSQNISATTIQAVLTPRTRAVICVHLAGWPCDMDPIMALAREQRLFVLEDCAQAHGATYKGRAVGSLGHAAAFSFCQDKIISTGGEGGMLVTDDEELWQRAWSYKDHGKSFATTHAPSTAPGFRWLHESFGTNWRMMEVQAAMGRIQLRKLEGWVAARRRNAEILDLALADQPALRITRPGPEFGHARYKYHFFVRPECLRTGWNRDRLLAEFVSRGVPCMTGGCPEIYREKAFDNSGWRPAKRLPVARELGESSLMLPVHPTLPQVAVEAAGTLVAELVHQATR